jgi:hypothetical protein
MDNSFDEQGSHAQQDSKGFLITSLPLLGNLIKWLASFTQWTEEEQEQAGIYMDRLGDE